MEWGDSNLSVRCTKSVSGQAVSMQNLELKTEHSLAVLFLNRDGVMVRAYNGFYDFFQSTSSVNRTASRRIRTVEFCASSSYRCACVNGINCVCVSKKSEFDQGLNSAKTKESWRS